MFCVQCGQARVEGRFCPACGAEQPVVAAQDLAVGLGHLRRGRIDEAERRLRAAVAAEPANARAHLALGVALLTKRQATAAEASLREAAALAPDLAEAHAYLGIALLDQYRVSDATAALDDALRQGRDSFIVRLKRGECLARLGMSPQAIVELEEAVRLAPMGDEGAQARALLARVRQRGAGSFVRRAEPPRLPDWGWLKARLGVASRAVGEAAASKD